MVDRAAMTVTCSGGLRYGDLALALAREGLALANLASLPHIAVAGAVSTATHGSGDRNGNLATAVAALEIVTSDGAVLTAARGDPHFDGLVVGLGAVGALTRVTLDVEPGYQVASGCSRASSGATCSSISTRSPRADTASACSPAGQPLTRFGSRPALIRLGSQVSRTTVCSARSPPLSTATRSSASIR